MTDKCQHRAIASSRRRNRRRRRDGIAAVEFAILLPLVILLGLAASDLGRVVYAYVTLSNAARCGAEAGSMRKFTPHTQPHWESEVRTAINEEMQSLKGFDAAQLTVAIATSTDDDGLFRAAIELSYPFQTAISWPGLPSQVQVRHRTEMRQIR